MSDGTVDSTVQTVAKRGRPRKYDFPSKLVCTVTGRTVLTNPSQFRKQLEASGLTIDAYVASYVCRNAKSQIKAGTLVQTDGVWSKVDKPPRSSNGGKRGRPKGSKNKAKPVVAPVQDTATTPDGA